MEFFRFVFLIAGSASIALRIFGEGEAAFYTTLALIIAGFFAFFT
jgi:hypothetical protein